MQHLICNSCGRIDEYTVKKTNLHNTAYCICGSYIKHLPKDDNPKLHFGKYSGRVISTMTTPDEIRYLYWLQSSGNIKNNLKNQLIEHLRKNGVDI